MKSTNDKNFNIMSTLNNKNFYCIVVVDEKTGDVTGVVTKTKNDEYVVDTSMFNIFTTRLKNSCETVMTYLRLLPGTRFEIRKLLIGAESI